VIGRPELADDPRFLRNQDRLDNKPALLAEIEPCFGSATVMEWVARFDKAGVACGPVQTIDQVINHPQVLANDMIVDVANPDGTTQKVLGRAFKISDALDIAPTGAPDLGQDTDAVLRDLLGMDAAAIAALRAEGAV
jgi:crotonobetainyl-CoA:carnitine CoA-transferase CaiB-like acyl-CoA transferase